MLKVPIDKILPVTEVRANISKVVNDVERGDIYVLTRGGKPTAVIAPVDYIKKCDESSTITENSHEVSRADEDVQKTTRPQEEDMAKYLPERKKESTQEPMIFEEKPQEIVEKNEHEDLPVEYHNDSGDNVKSDDEQPVPIKVSSGSWSQ